MDMPARYRPFHVSRHLDQKIDVSVAAGEMVGGIDPQPVKPICL